MLTPIHQMLTPIHQMLTPIHQMIWCHVPGTAAAHLSLTQCTKI